MGNGKKTNCEGNYDGEVWNPQDRLVEFGLFVSGKDRTMSQLLVRDMEIRKPRRRGSRV